MEITTATNSNEILDERANDNSTNAENPGNLLFYFGFKDEHRLRADRSTGNIFKVDETQAMIHEKDAAPIWKQVEAADMKEIKQFVDEKTFKKVRKSEFKNHNDQEAITIDHQRGENCQKQTSRQGMF